MMEEPYMKVRQCIEFRRHVSSLYDMCTRIVSRNLELYNEYDDLTYLPQTVKTDVMKLRMKSFRGFGSEASFICLLTSNVKSLTFRSTNLTDRMLQCIADKCDRLEELLFPVGNSEFTMVGLSQCIGALEHLRVLHVVQSREMNDDVLEIVGRNCKRLRSLSVRDCTNITDSCHKSVHNLSLYDLDISNTNITDDFLMLTKDSVLMKCLRDISLRDCAITREGLVCLQWDRLENINIIGAHIDDLSFIPATAIYKTLNFSI